MLNIFTTDRVIYKITAVCQNFIKDLKIEKKDQKKTFSSNKKRPQNKKKDQKKDLCVVCVVLAMQAPPYPGRKLEPITYEMCIEAYYHSCYIPLITYFGSVTIIYCVKQF